MNQHVNQDVNQELNDDPEVTASVRRGVSTYAQVLAHAGGKEIDTLMGRGERSAVCGAIYVSPPYDLQVPALPVARLSVNLTRSHVCGGALGDPQRHYDALRHSMFLAPAGVATAWRKDSPSRHLNIYFHPDVLEDTNDGGAAFDAQQPIFNTQAAGIGHLAEQLAAELGGQGLLKVEAADSLARLILVRLARRLRGPGLAAQPLSPSALARLRDYVLAHLSERILVADLARQIGLSPNRFAQAFSEQTRQSPHQFVLGLRVERAAHLLRVSKLSLVAVAHECGFASQQHLNNAMRRHLGTTPGRYRQRVDHPQEPGA